MPTRVKLCLRHPFDYTSKSKLGYHETTIVFPMVNNKLHRLYGNNQTNALVQINAFENYINNPSY